MCPKPSRGSRTRFFPSTAGVISGALLAVSVLKTMRSVVHEHLRQNSVGLPDPGSGHPFDSLDPRFGWHALEYLGAAYVVELCLKLIHSTTASDGMAPRGHDLRALYDALDDGTRQSIDNLAARCIRPVRPDDSSEASATPSLRDLLSRHRRAFERARYFTSESTPDGESIRLDPRELIAVARILDAWLARAEGRSPTRFPSDESTWKLSIDFAPSDGAPSSWSS